MGYAVTARSYRCFVAVIVISNLSGVRNRSFIMRFYRIVFVIINGIIKVSRLAVVSYKMHKCNGKTENIMVKTMKRMKNKNT